MKKLHAGPASAGKAKVVGGAKLRKSKQLEKATARSGEVKKIADKISKFTPGG